MPLTMTFCRTRSRRFSSQRGQTFLTIVILLSVFLLAAVGLVTDYSQVWAHRQMAQGAADAACQAGAADLFLQYKSPTAPSGISYSWFSSGASFDCSTNTTSPPCKYASFNGYSTGSNVNVSFPTSLPGVTAIDSGFGTVSHPYIQVTITDPVAMSFTKLVSSTGTYNITAKAACGLNPVALPIPMVVLDPSGTSVTVSGSAVIKIVGGPSQAIQVDSSSSTAVSVGTGGCTTGNPCIDLSQAGPAGNGADFDVVGNQTPKPSNVTVGSSGTWVANAEPLGDPFATIATPTKPGFAGTATPVGFATDGCPDPAGCVEFTGGDYTACSSANVNPGGNFCAVLPAKFNSFLAWGAPSLPHTYAVNDMIKPTSGAFPLTGQGNTNGFVFQATNSKTVPAGSTSPNFGTAQAVGKTVTDSAGIIWKNIGILSITPNTAIYAPGLYYIGSVTSNALEIQTGDTARMSTVAGDGTDGVTFYFSASKTLNVNSKSGGAGGQLPCTGLSTTVGVGVPAGCVVQYKTDGTSTTWTSPGVWAPAGGFIVQSRPLQCTGGPANPAGVPNTLYGNILFGPCTGAYGGGGKYRGFLLFQNRATAATPNLSGGGNFLLSGLIYLHNSSCPTSCTALTLSGSSGAGAYAFGDIVVDKVTTSGSSTINMILNPNTTTQQLRPTLLQ